MAQLFERGYSNNLILLVDLFLCRLSVMFLARNQVFRFSCAMCTFALNVVRPLSVAIKFVPPSCSNDFKGCMDPGLYLIQILYCMKLRHVLLISNLKKLARATKF